MNTKEVKLNSAQETFEFGQTLGKKCVSAELFTLSGDLGAGKTTLTQGIASGLGYKGVVNSPTFNILKQYKLNSPNISYLYHIDAYRLKSEADLIDLGIEEILENEDAVVVIEWPEKIKDILPRIYTEISIKSIDDNSRMLTYKQVSK